mgnify:CR=1 FL=1
MCALEADLVVMAAKVRALPDIPEREFLMRYLARGSEELRVFQKAFLRREKELGQ